MRFLFLFLDGVGLGPDDPETNPLARAEMPNLQTLLGGRKLLLDSLNGQGDRLDSPRASLLALDANLGVKGLPQSATGQSSLLTGKNVPQAIGYHYGPKPNPEVSAELSNGSLFSRMKSHGLRAELVNAYPPGYFKAIQSGRRLFSAIPLAVTQAGIALKTTEDLLEGQAIAADFTAQGWRDHLILPDTPVLSPREAGQRLADLAAGRDLAFFEYWLSDYAGHKQEMQPAIDLLQQLDQVLGGLLDAWDDSRGLILLTSDHGNLEDLSTRRHTANPVPGLLIGALAQRERFSQDLHDLSDVTPRILDFFGLSPETTPDY
jgi:2,3-bisphosphoglycerate-independent phosphoglycerate mutase